jgi:flagellar hook-associated protein 2
MGQIQSSIGLISGINYSDIVDQLMALQAKPRDALQTKNDDLKKKQTAITELEAMLYALKYLSDNLGKDAIYSKTDVTSNNAGLISVKSTGTPALGRYVFTPLRMAQNQHLLSSGFRSAADKIGVGKISLRFGKDLGDSLDLGTLNGGEGFSRGKILITDRSGAQAEIDLSTAQTVDDVLEAVNNNNAIDVTAEAVGGRIRLTDNTQQTVSNLRVQEVGGGTTAASLGLADINAAADSALGQNVVYLSRNLDINFINDGMGIRADTILSDIQYKLRDGTTLGDIDLSPIQSGGSTVLKERTLGEVIDRINAAAPGKLKAEIAPDGQRLILTDMTAGSGTFEVKSINNSKALEDLGLNGSAVDGVITGRKIIAGNKTVLLSSLSGGNGMGQLGTINLVDRSGAGAVVDLSNAETLEDVIDAINAAPVAIEARINQAQNGIELVDTNEGPGGNLIVANGDGTNTADKLKIAVDDAVGSINSGDLHLKIIAVNTKLTDLNGGAGVAQGMFRITDSTGRKTAINVNENVKTVEDLLKTINLSSAHVLAEINDAGDGIVIRDANGGSGTLKIEELGSTTARNLNLLGTVSNIEESGQITQIVDGSMTRTIDIAADDTLENLRDKINELGAGATASIFSDGSANPYRFSLTSNTGGKAGELVIDTSQAAISFSETTKAQDALLAIGGSTGTIVSSRSNTFNEVLAGAAITIQDVSSSPVTITVATSNTDLVANVKTFVDNYNKFRDKLDEHTKYDAASDTRSVLTGENSALQLNKDMSELISRRFSASSTVQSLGQIGISLDDTGNISLDESKLNSLLATNREGVKQLFTAADTGVSASFAKVIERLAGEDSSLLDLRNQALSDTIERNQKRIDDMDVILKKRQIRMLTEFYNMELAIAKMQNSLSTLDSIQWMLSDNSSTSSVSNS